MTVHGRDCPLKTSDGRGYLVWHLQLVISLQVLVHVQTIQLPMLCFLSAFTAYTNFNTDKMSSIAYWNLLSDLQAVSAASTSVTLRQMALSSTGET